MKSIKFANCNEFEIIECYNHGQRYINGGTRNCREIVVAEDTIGLDELKVLLTEPDNLSIIEVTMDYVDENGDMKTYTEVLKNFVYAHEIKDTLKGRIWFVIGEKTALEIERDAALQAIDTLLIAMEV